MYTSALEMHIEVLQGVQKIAAYTEDMFSPEEIDLHLTKQQLRLVEDIVNKKFEDSQVSLDYIKPLIEKNKKLKVFIPQTTEAIYEPSMVYGLLPSNYLYLVNNRSKVITSTTAGLCADVSAFQTSLASTVDYTEYVAVVPMVVPTVTTAPYYCKFTVSLTIGGVPTSVLVTPSGLWAIPSSKSGFVVSNYIMEAWPNSSVQVYWEYYRNNYYPNSFVFVTDDPAITKVDLLTTTGIASFATGGSSTANFGPVTYKIPVYNSTTITGYTESYADTTLLEGEDFYEQNLNVFYRPNKVNPRSTLNKQYLMAYESKNFLISELVVDYVRIPKQISLSLNQVSQLGGNGPSIVVNRTVEYLKLIIENPTYPGVLQDNKLRDQV